MTVSNNTSALPLVDRIPMSSDLIRFFDRWFLFLLVILQTVGTYMAYRCRYWINNDTIGSLDIAQALRSGNWWQVPNALWGSGWGILLTLAPKGDFVNGWFLQHVISATLATFVGAMIYLSMCYLGADKLLSFLIALSVNGAVWASRSPVFLTSDSLSTAICAVYLFVLIVLAKDGLPRSWWAILLLAILHFFAYLTRAINIYMLMPAVVILVLFVPQKASVTSKLRVIAVYYVPLLLLTFIWCVVLFVKYDDWLLSSTSKYNFALITDYHILDSIRDSKYDLPASGTYWWSDPTPFILSLKAGFPWISTFKRILVNALNFIKVFAHIPILAISLISILPALYRERPRSYFVKTLVVLALWNLILYLLVMVQERFVLPSVVFAAPLLYFAIRKRRVEGEGDSCSAAGINKYRLVLQILLVLCICHSVVSGIVIAAAAPGDGVCQLAKSISQQGNINGHTDILIASINEKSYHYGAYIAHLLGGKAIAADIVDNNLKIQSYPTALIYVNSDQKSFPSKIFSKYSDFVLSKLYPSGRRDKAILGLYLPRLTCRS